MQEAWLDRVTGRVCLAISARGMAITGIDDRRYWNWIPTEESRLDIYTHSVSHFYVVVFEMGFAILLGFDTYGLKMCLL